jgi:hypothetical protein
MLFPVPSSVTRLRCVTYVFLVESTYAYQFSPVIRHRLRVPALLLCPWILLFDSSVYSPFVCFFVPARSSFIAVSTWSLIVQSVVGLRSSLQFLFMHPIRVPCYTAYSYHPSNRFMLPFLILAPDWLMDPIARCLLSRHAALVHRTSNIHIMVSSLWNGIGFDLLDYKLYTWMWI